VKHDRCAYLDCTLLTESILTSSVGRGRGRTGNGGGGGVRGGGAAVDKDKEQLGDTGDNTAGGGGGGGGEEVAYAEESTRTESSYTSICERKRVGRRRAGLV